MPRYKNLVGQVFGRLTVIELADKGGTGKHAIWRCLCICGNLKLLSSNSLRNGTQSCGCLQHESPLNKTHGHTRSDNGRNTPTYRSWSSAVQRTTNPNHVAYHRYGGANPPVTICPEWRNFTVFLADMGERRSGTTLGRILDTGNYESGNCEWQTPAEQGLARRNKRALKLQNEELQVA